MRLFIIFITFSLLLFANIGTIMVLKGKATIKRDLLLNAKMGMPIFEGDQIKTSDNTQMQVMLKDETIITIGANSSFDFKEYKYDTTKNSKVYLAANEGSFRAVTGDMGKIAPDRFRIKTLSATIGIRGTDFGVDITPEYERIHCYSGGIWIEYDKGGVESILSGMMLDIRQNGIKKEGHHKMPKVIKEKMENYTIKNINNLHKSSKEISDTSSEILNP